MRFTPTVVVTVLRQGQHGSGDLLSSLLPSISWELKKQLIKFLLIGTLLLGRERKCLLSSWFKSLQSVQTVTVSLACYVQYRRYSNKTQFTNNWIKNKQYLHVHQSLYTIQCMVYTEHYTELEIHNSLNTIRCTQYTVHGIWHTTRYTQWPINSKQCTVHCTQ